VLVESLEMPDDTPTVRGYDFNAGVDHNKLFESFLHHGFQASHFGEAVQEIDKMRRWRLSDEPVTAETPEHLRAPEIRAATKTTIFLGYTSNQVSCGNREVLRFLAQHKLIDCMVTTGGAIEEDLMKCLAPHYSGIGKVAESVGVPGAGFTMDGKSLRLKGLNRIGNMIVPNKNYCALEEWMYPILDAMLAEQKEQGTKWTPSKMIDRLGQEIDNEDSIWYWCHKNKIPVFSPAITDGAVGDNIYFHSYKSPGLILDICADIRGINDIALKAPQTGMIILGGGLIKHHICNANLMRNGADYTVFVNTGQEFDGSDAGARPDEAVSWGKIKMGCNCVKIYADASFVFPLLVAQTFAKDLHGDLCRCVVCAPEPPAHVYDGEVPPTPTEEPAVAEEPPVFVQGPPARVEVEDTPAAVLERQMAADLAQIDSEH